VNIAYDNQFHDDLDEAYFSALVRDPRQAQRLLSQIDQTVHLIADGRIKGQEVELTNGERVRRWRTAPYILYYRDTPDEIRMIRLHHQSRRSIER
jgi:plasmid stabilization system protein ParE